MYMTQKQIMIDKIISAANCFGFSDVYSTFKSHFGSQVVILMYHRVSENNNELPSGISASNFNKQVSVLNKYF